MSAVDIVNADRGMIYAVLEHLREADMTEMLATEAPLEKLPDVIMRHKVFAFCAVEYQFGPVAIWGMTARRSGVGGGFAFGTDHWGVVVLPMVRQIRSFVLPFLEVSGFHRVEAVAMAHRDDVARFMRLIGAKPEATLQGYGSGGEDFISYRWLADEHRGRSASRQTAAHDYHATH
jgi:hypothetical protein